MGGGESQVRAADECDGEINGINKDKGSEKVKIQKTRMSGLKGV